MYVFTHVCIAYVCIPDYTSTSTACDPLRVQVQRTISNHIARSVHHQSCSCQMLRLSMSNTVRVTLQVQRASPNTRTIARSSSSRTRATIAVQVVHARGQDRYIARAVHAKTLYKWHKHSTYVQAQALIYTTCITSAVHAKCGTSSSRTRARLVHCPGCPCQNTVQVVQNTVQVVQAQ